MVGVAGLEPATSRSRTEHATNCATPRRWVEVSAREAGQTKLGTLLSAVSRAKNEAESSGDCGNHAILPKVID